MKGIQNVQIAIQNRLVAEAGAQEKIARAKGDSAVTIINALAEANSIRLRREQITPEYVEYIRWVNAGKDVPRVPSTVLGRDGSYIYNLPK